MKTAEEILAKRISVFPSDENMTDEAIKRNVIAAMEEYAAMTEPELTELPKVFAFKNNPDSPNHDLLKERFNCLIGKDFDMMCNYYYGRSSEGIYMWFTEKTLPKDVVELTEQQFLDLTEPKPELTKLPDNFYFQYVDEKDREVLIERFGKITGRDYYFFNLGYFYGIDTNGHAAFIDKIKFRNSTEITQADFIRLTEPEKKVEPEQPKEKGLYQKYFIQKIVKNPDYMNKITDTFMGEDATPEFILKPTDSDAEYFVLRLDDGGSDPIHVEACRQAVLTYATMIRNHLPELSGDLFKKYSKNTIPDEPPEPDFPYKGDIKDFPKEVVEWMLDNQVKQGNKRDISVFEKSRFANKINGGFSWDLVGDYFCTDVIVSKNFDLFFEKYPKKTSPEKTITGQIIEISERGILIELTKEQIKEFKIFETVTIK